MADLSDVLKIDLLEFPNKTFDQIELGDHLHGRLFTVMI
jgi:hypothetical protein